MISNVNSVISTPNGITARNLGNRSLQNMRANFATPNVINNVRVDISNEGRAKAQQLFKQMQLNNIDKTRNIEVANYDGNLTPQNHVDLSIFSQEAKFFLSQSSLFFGTNWTADDIVMAELGYQLIGALNPDASDTNNFVALANKYAELRQSLTDEFSGEELENRLNALSQAFDLSVEIQAHHRSTQTSIALRVEKARILVHNQIVQQGGQSPFFEGGKIELDHGEFNRIKEALSAGVREAVSHFAHLTRQFVLENGVIST
ncbi:MAG: hypothetical protein FWC89_13780, partial [Defluviitaleaceae bacterium]|nr:hypothetical protein [Defluviitaleaceae bacterium]